MCINGLGLMTHSIGFCKVSCEGGSRRGGAHLKERAKSRKSIVRAGEEKIFDDRFFGESSKS